MTDLVSVRVEPGGAGTEWYRGGEFSFPAALLGAGTPQRGAITLETPGGAVRIDAGGIPLVEREELVAALRLARTYTEARPLSSRIPLSYQLIPTVARRVVAKAIGRMRRKSVEEWAAFPRFPLDLSADALADLLELPRRPQPLTPVVLTHDIDTPGGLRNLRELFLPREEAAGARSTNFVVPCGWKIDHGLLGEVFARGHEIGVHGYNHSNKTPFLEEGRIRERLEAARPLIERYAAKGYRAPSLLRTPRLLAALSRHFTYDTSVPTSGGLFPTPNNGCATARPFRAAGILELPISMPRDAAMMFLGLPPASIMEHWRSCAERIHASGGVIVLLTHCEPEFLGRAETLPLYEELLAFFRGDARFRFQTCAEVASAWSEERP